VWSKDGGLLIEINGHEGWASSLCWPKDGRCIFSGSLGRTIRKWQLVGGNELVVIRGHTNFVTSLCLSPYGSHLFSASDDCAARIWDLETISELETHSGTTTKSMLLPCPPMDNPLPGLFLDWMQRCMCGTWKQHLSSLVGLPQGTGRRIGTPMIENAKNLQPGTTSTPISSQ
jgi:WD40 repeat protein